MQRGDKQIHILNCRPGLSQALIDRTQYFICSWLLLKKTDSEGQEEDGKSRSFILHPNHINIIIFTIDLSKTNDNLMNYSLLSQLHSMFGAN